MKSNLNAPFKPRYIISAILLIAVLVIFSGYNKYSYLQAAEEQSTNSSSSQKQATDDSDFQKQSSNDSDSQKQTSDNSDSQKQTSDDSTSQKQTSGDNDSQKQTSDNGDSQKQSSDDSDSQEEPEGKWVQEKNGWWYDNGDGTYARCEYIDGYWLDNNGWYSPAWYGKWNKNSTGWWFESGNWYPAGSWLKINRKWYYFDSNGYMKSSEWVRSSGKWYYLTETGAMAVSTTIDGYEIDENGIMIDNTPIEELIADSATAKLTNQIVLVIDHELTLWEKQTDGSWKSSKAMYCGYGKNGFSNPSKRVMGDKTTPLGAYELNYAFGIAENPGTEMTYRDITPTSYLSSEKETYNTWVESETWVDGEHLIDYTKQYKYAANIGFNINPTVYGIGAGIFLHCNGDKWYTSGCVCLSEEDMVWVLKKLKNGAYIIITQDKSEIRDY